MHQALLCYYYKQSIRADITGSRGICILFACSLHIFSPDGKTYNIAYKNSIKYYSVEIYFNFYENTV